MPIIRRALSLTICLFALALPSRAATHVWTGASSDLFSDPANWIGGSPGGDSNADLSFPSGSRVAATNDLTGLTVRSLAFSGTSYTIRGNAIAFAEGGQIFDSTDGPNVVFCNLVLPSELTVYAAGTASLDDGTGLTFSGSISGAGGIRLMGGGMLQLRGAAPNTYSGATRVQHGRLWIGKSSGVAAVSGPLRVEATGANYEHGEVRTLANEQIADTATVTIRGGGRLEIGGTETLGPLTYEKVGSLYTLPNVGAAILSGDVQFLPADNEYGSGTASTKLLLPATRTITAFNTDIRIEGLQAATPGAGIIVTGGSLASVDLIGTYDGPTRIDVGSVRLTNAKSAVTLRGGRVGGTVASLTAEGGELNGRSYPGLTSMGSIKLKPAVDAVIEIETSPTVVLNGVLDLGSARLQLQNAPSLRPGSVYTLISNTSAQQVVGTFAGLPEGAIFEERWKISYAGGNGNDVTITDVGLANPQLGVSTPPTPTANQSFPLFTTVYAYSDPPVTPTGTVTYMNGATVLATATLSNGTAAPHVTLAKGHYSLTAHYSGDSRVKAGDYTFHVAVYPPKPVITEVQPATVNGGVPTQLVVRGTNFSQGAQIGFGSFYYQATLVSATELRIDYTPPRYDNPVQVQIQVAQPDPGWTTSDPFPITVNPGPPPPQTLLTFQTNSVSAPVTPGAMTAWLSIARRPIPYSTRYEYRSGLMTDDDQDGLVTWTFQEALAPLGMYTAVDLSARSIMAGQPNTPDEPQPSPFPEKMFLRDANGNFSHLAIRLDDDWQTALWARPGVGAWQFYLSDGAGSDLDGALNGYFAFNTSNARPVGTSPAPPAGVESGDLFVAIAYPGDHWFGDRVEDHLDDAAVGSGIVSLVSDRAFVSEERGSLRFMVARRDGTDGEVRVQYETSLVSGIAGAHYAEQTGEIVFGPGEILKPIDIPIVNDDAYSGNTTFTLTLFDAAGAPLVEPSTATIEIADDDPQPVLSISSSSASVPEHDSGVHEVPLIVRLTGATRKPAFVTWFWRTSPYGTQTMTQLEFAPGETQKTVFMQYTGNTIPEPDRQLEFSLGIPIDATVPSPATQSVTITDDDFATVSIADASVNESRGTVELRISLSQSTQKPLKVTYSASNGTATAGADYTATTGTLTFTGETLQIVTIPILNDSAAEAVERFDVTLSAIEAGVAGRTAALVTIVDDDVPPASAPSNVIATANGTNIHVTWSAVPSASSYEVYRSQGGIYELLATVPGTSFINAIWTDGTFVYRIKAVSGGTASPFSAPDAATIISYTDDPIIPGVTRMKSIHLAQVRAAVTSMRRVAGLTPQTYPVVLDGHKIRLQDITQLRTGLQEARAAIGLPPMVFTDPTLTPTTRMKAVHLTELRDGCR